MASEELDTRLRDDLQNLFNSRMNEVQAEISRVQTEFQSALSDLVDRSIVGPQSDGSLAASIAELLLSSASAGAEASDTALLKAAIDDLDDQRSQGAILTSLVSHAAAFAPRVVFFVVRNEQTTGWRARGVDGLSEEEVRSFSLPLSADTLLGEVVASRGTWSGGPGSRADEYQILRRLGGEPPVRMAAVPLIARGKAVAVLYADSSTKGPGSINLEALESLVRVAGMAVELLAVSRSAPIDRPARVEAPVAEPEPTGAEAVAPVVEESEPRLDEPSAPVVEEAAPAEPVVEEVQPEPEPVQPAAPSPLATARRWGSADQDYPVEVGDDEKPLHNEARRFARLLVSEIKLYNEQKVQDGRANSNLYDRLREDIDRSREMYEKRVRPEVAARYDYFHQELVRTLAEGDEGKLGGSYPGAAVSA